MIVTSSSSHGARAARSAAILSHWFADLDDASRLEPSAEPFRSCYRRWYGKDDATDREIRAAFEGDLRAVTEGGVDWRAELEDWARAPQGLLALVVLLDQMPRNMYRGTPRMYAHDGLALSAARHAIRHHEGDDLPLVRRMFLPVPLMHAEELAVQREMLGRFEQLAAEAARRSPHQRGFFEQALGSARRHLEVIAEHGRFPHRNAILGRASSPAEEEYLRRPDAGF